MKGCFTPQQIAQLLAAAPDDEWRALVALGYYTGGALARPVAASLGRVGPRAENAIGFKQKKTGGAVMIPAHPGLCATSRQLPAGVGRAPMLPRLSAKSGTGKAACRRHSKRSWSRRH